MSNCKFIMIQGTGSSCGKSIISTAFCRIFKEDGFKVAPFKSQNMALNSFVTKEGGEMARAQVVQAIASGIEPHTDMNPILMKPTADHMAQIIIQGKAIGNMSVKNYIKNKKKLFNYVKESFRRLRSQNEVLVIEGAGSPAEINLKSHDIVNMKIAKLTKSPVILVGDIDKGGVFASLIGTLELLTKSEKDLVKGFIINKFRGDVSLLDDGLRFLERRTGKKVLGVVPYIKDLLIPDEDAVSFDKLVFSNTSDKIIIAIVHLPHIADISDYDPFLAEKDVVVKYARNAEDLKGADIVILPGTKATISDLNYIKSKGFAEALRYLDKEKKDIIGICGGFQMLGNEIHDKARVESKAPYTGGFGFFDMETHFKKDKITKQVKGVHIDTGFKIKGYEIHMGRSIYKNKRPLFKLEDNIFDGTTNKKGNIWGTYIHGVFANNEFRKALLDRIRIRKNIYNNPKAKIDYNPKKEIEKFADVVRTSVDTKEIYKIMDRGI